MRRILSLLSTVALCGSLSAQSISSDVVASAGGTLDNGIVSLDYTVGELAVTDIGSGPSLNQGFHNTVMKKGIKVNARIYLQGAYDDATSSMRDDLRAGNFIPETSPYVDGITTTTAVLANADTNNAIVDWVFVEVRDRGMNNLVVAFQSALVQRDGDIVDVDGVSTLEFDVFPGTYFVSVNHRNHLGVISNMAIVLGASGMTVLDYTDGSVITAGGANAQAEVESGVRGMFAGDASENGVVSARGVDNDVSAVLQTVLTAPGNFFGLPTFQASGYSNQDVNMDGLVKARGVSNDISSVLQTVLSAPGNFFGLPTFTITTQVPN